jgi:acyl-CoA oxidase
MAQLSEIQAGPIHEVLSRLLSLFALSSIVSPSANTTISLIEDGYLLHTHLTIIRELIETILDELMPDAIALTDAWNLPDASLASAIGCDDGNAYEWIMCWTRQ